MSEQKHTPGPWVAECETLREAQKEGAFLWWSGADGDKRVGSVWRRVGDGTTGLPGSIETTEANAHLIAAAPDYHEGVADALKCDDGYNCEYVSIPVKAWKKILAAHAKAENRS